MTTKRKIEIFSAGCSVCDEVVDRVKAIACSSCDVLVLNMNDAATADRARQLGVKSVPAVAVNGKLADCCVGKGVDETMLRAAGIVRP